MCGVGRGSVIIWLRMDLCAVGDRTTLHVNECARLIRGGATGCDENLNVFVGGDVVNLGAEY